MKEYSNGAAGIAVSAATAEKKRRRRRKKKEDEGRKHVKSSCGLVALSLSISLLLSSLFVAALQLHNSNSATVLSPPTTPTTTVPTDRQAAGGSPAADCQVSARGGIISRKQISLLPTSLCCRRLCLSFTHSCQSLCRCSCRRRHRYTDPLLSITSSSLQ